MELLLLAGLAVGVWVLYDRLGDRREREMAGRLARAHEKLKAEEAAGLAAGAVDAAAHQAKVEAEAIRHWSGRG